MAQRRERPPDQRLGRSIGVRLRDGTTRSIRLDVPLEPAPADRCCFCGGPLEGERVELTARWDEAGEERRRDWGAHHGCLADRLHDAVKGDAPF